MRNTHTHSASTEGNVLEPQHTAKRLLFSNRILSTCGSLNTATSRTYHRHCWSEYIYTNGVQLLATELQWHVPVVNADSSSCNEGTSNRWCVQQNGYAKPQSHVHMLWCQLLYPVPEGGTVKKLPAVADTKAVLKSTTGWRWASSPGRFTWHALSIKIDRPHSRYEHMKKIHSGSNMTGTICV
jgi:hypothetical protein